MGLKGGRGGSGCLLGSVSCVPLRVERIFGIVPVHLSISGERGETY